jgi:hypothetical protein
MWSNPLAKIKEGFTIQIAGLLEYNLTSVATKQFEHSTYSD